MGDHEHNDRFGFRVDSKKYCKNMMCKKKNGRRVRDGNETEKVIHQWTRCKHQFQSVFQAWQACSAHLRSTLIESSIRTCKNNLSMPREQRSSGVVSLKTSSWMKLSSSNKFKRVLMAQLWTQAAEYWKVDVNLIKVNLKFCTEIMFAEPAD